MRTLSDRLKSLGVKIGAKDLPPVQRGKSIPVEEIAAGRFLDTVIFTDRSDYVLAPHHRRLLSGLAILKLPNKTLKQWFFSIRRLLA
jgi:hypothetical protein